MSPFVQAMKISRQYTVSAFVFSITRAVFVGYLYRDFSIHFYGASTFGGSGFFWAAVFAVLFLFVSFAPKPKWGYYLNPLIVTAIVWLLYYFGMNFAPIVQAHIKAVVSVSIGSFGGPIWIMVATWIWHFFVCLQLFGEEKESV